MRRWRHAAVAAALAMTAAPAAAASLWQPPPADAVEAALKGDGIAYGPYRFRTVPTEPGKPDAGLFDEKRLEIGRGGATAWRSEPAALWTLVDVRDDIDRSGRPLAVLASYTGGAHCCTDLTFVALDGEPATFATLSLGNGDMPESADLFADADGDGQIDLQAYDQTFAYWIVSFAESPFTPVVLLWRDGGFHLNLAAMRRPPPTDADLAKTAAAIQADESWLERKRPPPLLWESMAAEIFAGNAPSAWRLLELAWPASFPGRAAFAADFRDQLKTSPWWNDVVALNPSGL